MQDRHYVFSHWQQHAQQTACHTRPTVGQNTRARHIAKMCSTAGAATATLHAVPAAPRVTRKPANHAFCRLPVRADGKTEWRRQRAVQPVVCVAEAQRDMDRVFETKLKYS